MMSAETREEATIRKQQDRIQELERENEKQNTIICENEIGLKEYEDEIKKLQAQVEVGGKMAEVLERMPKLKVVTEILAEWEKVK